MSLLVGTATLAAAYASVLPTAAPHPRTPTHHLSSTLGSLASPAVKAVCLLTEAQHGCVVVVTGRKQETPRRVGAAGPKLASFYFIYDELQSFQF